MPDVALTIESLCRGMDLPEWALDFRHAAGGRVLFGPGRLAELGRECRALGAARALVVTDPGIAGAGFVQRACESLAGADVLASVYAEVRENPTTEDVDRCVAFAAAEGVDLIVGLGGGSSLDTAKGCNFLLTNGGRMQDYWGVGKATKPMLPFVAVPTTAGTGSECQSFALIADAETHAKMACGDPKCAAAVSLLDPELTVTMPTAVTAHTGIDAIAHALETAVCNKRGEVSSVCSRAAWKLLDAGLGRVLADPRDLEARARMQLGSAFAGTAIENSMLGIAHSCANPLTAHYGIVHGQAVGAMLPHAIEFNRSDSAAAAIYEGLCVGGDLAQRVRVHLRACGMDLALRELGVDEAAIPRLAEEAAAQWTARFNPVPVDAEALARVYRAAW